MQVLLEGTTDVSYPWDTQKGVQVNQNFRDGVISLKRVTEATGLNEKSKEDMQRKKAPRTQL